MRQKCVSKIFRFFFEIKLLAINFFSPFARLCSCMAILQITKAWLLMMRKGVRYFPPPAIHSLHYWKSDQCGQRDHRDRPIHHWCKCEAVHLWVVEALVEWAVIHCLWRASSRTNCCHPGGDDDWNQVLQ